MDKHGNWMVLRQAIPGRKCSCVNPTTQDAYPGCNRCLGSGYAYVDRFVKGRKSREVRITQSLGAETRTAIMQMSPIDNIFYIQHNMKPTNIDYILEIALDPITQQPERPYRVLSVHDISDSRDHRDQNGRIEFFSVTAELKAWPEFEIG